MRLRFLKDGASALDLGENLGALSSPEVWLGIGVAVGQIGFDVTDQLVDRGEAAGADDIAGQVGEEALDQIEPGRGEPAPDPIRGRREVHLEARMSFEPCPRQNCLVGSK